MKLNDIITHAPRWFEEKISVHFESGPGLGKSATIEAMPAVLNKRFGGNYGISIVNGTLLTPIHMLGFGVPKHHADWTQMIFSDPFFMVTREGKRLCEYDGGVLFVDEAEKCDPDVKKVLGEGAYSRRFGPHEMPPNWVVWTAGNRAKDRSGSTKEFDHLINRRMLIEVSSDVQSLVDWMNANGAHFLTKSFVEAFPQIVFSAGVPEKQGPWCTPRSLMFVDNKIKLIEKYYGSIPEEPFVAEEIRGVIGDAATNQFIAHIKLETKLPKFADIVADPEGTPVPGADAPDARMLVCYNLAHRVCAKTIAPVAQYIKRLPQPFAITFARSMANQSPMLMSSKTMLDWMQENNSLMTLMHSLQSVK